MAQETVEDMDVDEPVQSNSWTGALKLVLGLPCLKIESYKLFFEVQTIHKKIKQHIAQQQD